MFGTTVEALAKHVDRSPDRHFIVGTERSLTYREYDEEVNRLANWFAAHDIGRGDNVGLLMVNCAELYAAILALHKLGAIANLWNFRLRGREIGYLAEHVGVKAVVYNAAFADNLAIQHDCPQLCVGAAPAEGAHDYGEVAGQSSAAPTAPGPRQGDPATVIYTSGTTGYPKGACYTHTTQLTSAIQYCLEMGLDRGRRGLTAAPVIHGGATNFFFAYLFIGATFVDSGIYRADTTLQLIRDFKATEMMAVPAQVQEMLNVAEDKGLPREHFESLRLIRMGGSPYPRNMVDRVHDIFDCHLLNTFGMTENCSNVTTMHTGYDPEEAWTTIGKPTYFWDARVVEIKEDEGGAFQEVAHPGRGQLVVSGPQNVKAYYKSDQAPRYHDDWLYARDVVDFTASGYMQIVDRVDDTILSGGENIYPQEVEMVLRDHPLVEDAAVIGLPDERWGQIVVALIVRKSDELDEQAIEAYCLGSDALARYKRPRRVLFVDALEKNVFGKIERYKLREKYAWLTDGSPGAGG